MPKWGSDQGRSIWHIELQLSGSTTNPLFCLTVIILLLSGLSSQKIAWKLLPECHGCRWRYRLHKRWIGVPSPGNEDSYWSKWPHIRDSQTSWTYTNRQEVSIQLGTPSHRQRYKALVVFRKKNSSTLEPESVIPITTPEESLHSI